MMSDPDELPEKEPPGESVKDLDQDQDQECAADEQPFDAPENGFGAGENPLTGMRVRDVRNILDNPAHPLYDATLASSQKALKPLIDSQARWTRLLSSSTLDQITKSNRTSLAIVDEILKNAGPKIDMSAFTSLNSEATRKIFEGFQPRLKLGEQFGKIAADLASQSAQEYRYPRVRVPRPGLSHKDESTGRDGSKITSTVGNQIAIEPRDEPIHSEPDDLTLAEVSNEAAEQAGREDRNYLVFLGISSSLEELTQKADEEASRHFAEKAVASALNREDRRVANNRHRWGFAIGLGSFVLVAATFVVTILKP